jgi:hypothetical protein
MIYATAHILHSRHFGARQGINAFLHQDSAEVPGKTEAMDLLERASNAPGKIVACAIDLPPGGNEVDAYLDLLYSNEIPLSEALKQTRERIEQTTANHLVEHIESRLFFTFHTTTRVGRETAFTRISAALLSAEQSPKPPPIQILAERAADLWIFRLDTASQDRLKKIHGADWTAMPLRVHIDVAEDFSALHGSLLPHVVEVLTQLAPRLLQGLGGVLVQTREGHILLELDASPWMRP